MSVQSGSLRRPRTRSLSWSKQPLRALLRLSWPISVSLLSFGVMTLVDTLFVSSIGTSALAGVGLAGTATFALYCFSFGLLRGTKVLVSQSLGAGRRDELGAHLGAGIAVALVLGLATAVLGHYLSSLLPLVAASVAAGRAAESYLSIRTLGAPVVLTFVALREYRYGESDTRSPMVAALVGNAANVALNWLLVIHLQLGVRGSASATLFGHSLELLVVLYAQSRHGFPIWGARLRHVRQLVQIGIPTGIQFLLEMGSFAMLTAIVSSLGETQMAAHQIAIQVVSFSFLPTAALAEAGSVLAGQAVGAGRDALVRRVARDALIASSLYTGLWTVLLVLFGAALVSIFTVEPGLAGVALSLLRVAALFQIADGAATVARGVLRGAGDVVVPARLGVVCAWLCTPPLAYFLGRVLGLGALGGWLGLLLEISVLAALCWIRLRGDAWLPLAAAARARLRDEADAELGGLGAESAASR